MISLDHSSSSSTTFQDEIVFNGRVVLRRRAACTNADEVEMNIHSFKNEQEQVQKKTFTKWMNIYLAKHQPPDVITDLFEDLRDGSRLIALLKVLSKQKIPIEKGRTRAHQISNVNNALKFLESQEISLVNINTLDIVDGRSTTILGLIWMIILSYQIQDSGTIDEESIKSSTAGKQSLLEWVRKRMPGEIEGLHVNDFTSSWCDGSALGRLIHAIRPELIDLDQTLRMDVRERLEHLFKIAEEQLKIPSLIDADDLSKSEPDEKSIMTYIAQFPCLYSDPAKDKVKQSKSIDEKRKELRRWLADALQVLTCSIDAPINDIQAEYKDYIQRTKEFVKKHEQSKEFEGNESENSQESKEAFNEIQAKMNQWRLKLDYNLSGNLQEIVKWIYRAEENLDRVVLFQPSNYSAEENYRRFKQLFDKHQIIFTKKQIIQKHFQCEQRLQKDHIAPEHIANLDERLQAIMTKSDERRRQFDYEQSYWRMQKHFNQLHDLIELLNRKQGDLDETKERFALFDKIIHQDRLVYNMNSLLLTLTCKAQNYNELKEKDEQLAKKYLADCQAIGVALTNISNELESYETVFETIFESWRIHNESFDLLEQWLNKERAQHLSTIDYWTGIQRKLSGVIEHLILVYDEQLTEQLRTRYLSIKQHWEETSDEFQILKRKEFHSRRTNTMESLQKILEEIQQNFICSPKALQEHQNRLIELQTTLPTIQRTIQDLIELSERFGHNCEEANVAEDMKLSLDTCANLYQQVETTLPLILNRNKTLLEQLQHFDQTIQECYAWFKQVKQLFSQYSISVSVKWIEEYLEQNRSLIAQMELYRSIVDSLGRLVESMKRTNDQIGSLEFSSIDDQCCQVIKQFQKIERQANQWDHLFTQHYRFAKDFHRRQELLKEWIDRAQTILDEHSEDFDSLIRRHQEFFEHIDDEIFHDFIKAEQTLLLDHNPMERSRIECRIKSLENKRNTIICFARIRLLRLEYDRTENYIQQKFKQADETLNEELEKFKQQCDPGEILHRHEQYFQRSHFQVMVGEKLQDLQKFATAVPPEEREELDRRTSDLHAHWTTIQHRMDDMRRKLRTMATKYREFETKLDQVEAWLTTVEQLSEEITQNNHPLDQFRQIVDQLQNEDQKKTLMSNNVESIENILVDLMNEGETGKNRRYQKQFNVFSKRYHRIFGSIGRTLRRCAVIISAKRFHEQCLKLTAKRNQINDDVPSTSENFSEVASTFEQQNRSHKDLKDSQNENRNVWSHGNESSQQLMIDKDNQQDLQKLQILFQDKPESSEVTPTPLIMRRQERNC